MPVPRRSSRARWKRPTASLLHTNNKNGKGITTDGTHIWVVNDIGGMDKVYKYTVDGTYVGRWNIDPANAKPTGITIDPTGASDAIWIVDNVTDSVYQYDGGSDANQRQRLGRRHVRSGANQHEPAGNRRSASCPSQLARTTTMSTELVLPTVSDALNGADVWSRVGARPALSNGRYDLFSDFGRSDRNEDLVADVARVIAGTRLRP